MKKVLVLICSFLAGCANADFPFCCDQTGISDVPYVDTYLFNQRAGYTDISGDLSILSIISQADLANLFNAANVSKVPGTGAVGGHLVPVGGGSQSNVILEATDGDGNKIGDLFYNSLGGIPDFSTTNGTSVSGGFTLLNTPPGEVYLKAVQGGRGKDSTFSFVDAVSLINVSIVPVVPPFVGAVGSFREYGSQLTVLSGTAVPLGLKGLSVLVSGGKYRFPYLGSNSQFIIKASSPGYLDTYHKEATDLGSRPQGVPDVTQNTFLLSKTDLQNRFSRLKLSGLISAYDDTLGVLIGKGIDLDGTARSNTVVTVKDDQGVSLGTVFYPGTYHDPNQKDPVPTYFWFDSTGTRFNYIDSKGVVQPASPPYYYDCTLTRIKNCPLTDIGVTDGSFIALNLPPGMVHLTAKAQSESDKGLVLYGGEESVDIFPGTASIGSASLHDISMIPAPLGKNTIFQNLLGNVYETDGKSVVGFAALFALGNAPSLMTTDIYGGFNISLSGKIFLDQASYTFKVSRSLYLDTYQEVKIDDTYKSLTIYSSQIFSRCLTAAGLASQYDPSRGSVTGMIIDNTTGRGTDGIILEATDFSGNVVGEVRYFDSFGLPTLSKASSKNGKYFIFNLPSGLIQVRVTSQDDSGNRWVHIYPDSVTLADLLINNSPTPSVQVSGVTRDLYGPPVGGVALSIRGEKTRFNSAGDGTFSRSFSSYNHEAVKARAPQGSPVAPSLDTYNLFETLSTDMSGMTFWALTTASVLSQTQNQPFVVDFSKGILGGRVTTLGLSSPAQLSTYQSSPVTDITQQRMTDGLFDGDNEVDIALLNSTDSTLTILLGGGDGTFLEAPGSPYCLPLGRTLQAGQNCPTGAIPVAIRATDINGDGLTDLIVANSGTDSVTVMLGTGKGSFSPASAPLLFPSGSAPAAIAFADFNNDQKMDIIILCSGNNTFYTILGNGDGTFGSTHYPFSSGGSTPVALVRGDFNQDGNFDLAVLNQGSKGVNIFFGIGNGGFVPAPNSPIPVGSGAFSIASDDLNGDGKADLVIANKGSGTLTVLLGNGGGLFKQAKSSPITLSSYYGPPDYPEIVTLNDLNFDGRPDILVTTTAGNLLHLIGLGDGTFNPPTVYPVGGTPSNFLVADFNDDFFSDLILFQKNSGGFSQLSFLPGEVIPLSNVRLETLNLNGTPVGDLRYLDLNGNILYNRDISGNIISPAGETDSSGRFIVYNVPPGINNVHAVQGASGNRFMIAYQGGATMGEIAANAPHAAAIRYSGTTGDIVGDQILRPVETVQISLMGASTQTISDSPNGNFSFSADANNFLFLKLRK